MLDKNIKSGHAYLLTYLLTYLRHDLTSESGVLV